MALTKEEQTALLNEAAQEQGCPPGVADRLDAFVAGMKAAIISMGSKVSLDANAARKTSPAAKPKSRKK